SRCDAAGVGDAVEPCWQTTGHRDKLAVSIDGTSVDGSLLGEVVRRSRDEDLIAHECDRRTIPGMKAFVLDAPRRTSVATTAKADGGRGYHEVRAAWMHPDLVDVGVDVDRRMPGRAAILGTGNPSHMDIHE